MKDFQLCEVSTLHMLLQHGLLLQQLDAWRSSHCLQAFQAQRMCTLNVHK